MPWNATMAELEHQSNEVQDEPSQWCSVTDAAAAAATLDHPIASLHTHPKPDMKIICGSSNTTSKKHKQKQN